MADNPSSRVDLPIRKNVGRDVVRARRYGLEMASEMGFVKPEATKIAAAISELVRSIEDYAEHGTITLLTHIGEDAYFEIVARGHGPSIANMGRALAERLELLGVRQIMDTLVVKSTLGLTIEARKRLR
jgi:anti-sigma regulatory factor (Ser/Thr protein kinase)